MSSAQYRCSLSHTSHVTDRQSGLGFSPVEKSLASLPRDDARLNLACRRSQSAISSLTGRTAQCSSTPPHPLPLSVLSHHLHLSLCPFSLCHWPASLTRALVFPSAPGTASSRKQNSLCEQCAVKDEGVSVGPHPAIYSATGEAVKELPEGTVPMHSSLPLLGHFEEVALLASSVYPAGSVVEAIGSEVLPQSAVFLLRPHPAEICNNGQGDGSNWCFFVISY